MILVTRQCLTYQCKVNRWHSLTDSSSQRVLQEAPELGAPSQSELIKLLSSSELFADLSEDEKSNVADHMQKRRYRANEALFYEGDEGSHLYLISSGRVSISSRSPEGREVLVAFLGPGEIIGELSLLDGEPRSAEARAVEATEVYVLSSAALTSCIERSPGLSWALLKMLARRLRKADEAVADAAFLDVAGRVAKRLVDLAEQHGSPTDSGVRIGIPVTQEQLAAMVGATREGVNRALAGFANRGILERKGRFYVVKDMGRLVARAT